MQKGLLWLGLAGLILAAGPGQAAGPPLKVLVGFAPGGSIDALARVLSEPMGKILDRVIVVENRTGAGGQIGAVALKTAMPDGNTIMLANDHIGVILPLIMKDPGFDPIADFAPIGQAVTVPSALAVWPGTGVHNLREFDTWLKANRDKASYGVPAVGSTPQFTGYVVAKRSGVQMTAVPYRGGAPIAQDLAAGQIPVGATGVADLLALHRDGRVRIIAVNGTSRVPALPDVETYRENGFEGLDIRTWYSFFAPKGVPESFVRDFSNALKATLEQPEIAAKLVNMGLDPAYASPADMAQSLVRGRGYWKPVIEESGYEKQ